MKNTDHRDEVRLRRPGIRQWRGRLDGRGLRVGIVCSTFNTALTRALADAAVDELLAAGVRAEDIELAWVPGAFEVPLVLSRWAAARHHDALVALGVIIQGDTPHAALIAGEVTRAVSELSRAQALPVLDGVVAVNNTAQAEERCLGRAHNRGRHAARAAIRMARLLAALERGS